jgi:Rieske 2Fe-2S family protein
MTATSLPPSLISTLAGSYYTDPAVFSLEQSRIFESMWFCAVRSAELATPGSFRLVQVGRESVLVVRGRDNALRAFLNVCRHRGAKLCTQESGQVKRALQCPYHAWTYGLDGKLVAAPNLPNMPDVDRVEYGLIPVHLQEWLGYAWVCLADQPPSFVENVQGAVVGRLGDLESIERYDIDELEVGRRIVYDVKANWKLIIENFMECYHCATIHPELTEVLPEFADGYAAQYYVGHGAKFGEDVKGFTVDGSEGFDRLPGVEEDQDRRYYAITVKPTVFINLVPDHIIFHRMYPLALLQGRGRLRPRCLPLRRAVPPGQRAGLRGVRAVPAGDGLPGLRARRGARPVRAPHRGVPRLAHRHARHRIDRRMSSRHDVA